MSMRIARPFQRCHFIVKSPSFSLYWKLSQEQAISVTSVQ